MRRRILVVYVLAVAVSGTLLGVATWIQTNRARTHVTAATEEIRGLREDLSPRTLEEDPERILTRLREARNKMATARSQLGAVWIAPVRLLPFVGRQLRAGIALTDGAEEMIEVAEEAIRAASPLLQDASPDRVVETLAGLEEAVTRADTRLATIALPLPQHLIGPLRDASTDLRDQIEDARARLSGIAEILPVLRSMVGEAGMRRYLLGLNNNAEMRATGGMTLSYGVLTFEAGRFGLDDVRSTEDFALTDTEVALPDGYARSLLWLSPGHDPRNTGVSGIFPQVAPVLAEMYARKTGTRVDGVVTVDVVTLQDIVGIVGPIDVPEIGQTLTGKTTVEILLSRVYKIYGDDIEGRRAALGHAARAVASRLSAGGYSYGAVADRLGNAIRERRLMVWSPLEEEQKAFDRAGVAGSLPVSRLPVYPTVQNVGATKLDYYLDLSVVLDLELEGGEVSGTVTLLLTNTVHPGGLPTYVVGPYEGVPDPPGMYRGLVSIWFPKGTSIEGVQGDGVELGRDTDAGYALSTAYVTIPAGGTAHTSVKFFMRLADMEGGFPLEVVPQGRLEPVPLEIDARLGRNWSGPKGGNHLLDDPVQVNWVWRNNGE